MRLTHTQAVLVMVAVTLMWSIAGVVTRQLEAARSFEVTFWRSFFTALSLAVLLPLTAPAVSRGRQFWRTLPWRHGAFWLSGLCWSVMFTAFMMALTQTTVANVLVVMAVGPLLTALVAWAALRQHLPPRTWGAIVVAGAGILWMYGQQWQADQVGFWGGTLTALCVPVAGAVQWTVVQRGQQHGGAMPLVPSVLLGALISSAVTLPLALPFQASLTDVLWLAFLGLVQLAIPCTLSVWCAQRLKAPEVALLALLEVIFGIALAWLGAGETPSASVLTGGALVMLALIANELLGLRPT